MNENRYQFAIEHPAVDEARARLLNTLVGSLRLDIQDAADVMDAVDELAFVTARAWVFRSMT